MPRSILLDKWKERMIWQNHGTSMLVTSRRRRSRGTSIATDGNAEETLGRDKNLVSPHQPHDVLSGVQTPQDESDFRGTFHVGESLGNSAILEAADDDLRAHGNVRRQREGQLERRVLDSRSQIRLKNIENIYKKEKRANTAKPLFLVNKPAWWRGYQSSNEEEILPTSTRTNQAPPVARQQNPCPTFSDNPVSPSQPLEKTGFTLYNLKKGGKNQILQEKPLTLQVLLPTGLDAQPHEHVVDHDPLQVAFDLARMAHVVAEARRQAWLLDVVELVPELRRPSPSGTLVTEAVVDQSVSASNDDSTGLLVQLADVPQRDVIFLIIVADVLPRSGTSVENRNTNQLRKLVQPLVTSLDQIINGFRVGEVAVARLARKQIVRQAQNDDRLQRTPVLALRRLRLEISHQVHKVLVRQSVPVSKSPATDNVQEDVIGEPGLGEKEGAVHLRVVDVDQLFSLELGDVRVLLRAQTTAGGHAIGENHDARTAGEAEDRFTTDSRGLLVVEVDHDVAGNRIRVNYQSRQKTRRNTIQVK
jgi:hypothetical protein